MKLLIIAPAGKMGQQVTREALLRPEEFTIIGGVERPGLPCIGQDIGVAAGTASVGAITYDSIHDIIGEAEGVIDFSTVDNSMNVFRTCHKHCKPLVTCTTGFCEEQKKEMRDAAKDFPFLFAGNTSKAINMLYEVAGRITEVFGSKADIEITDIHDREKIDAPSGTAGEFGEVIAYKLGQELSDIADYGRRGRRIQGHIGFHSLRIGNVSSVHNIVFGLEGERIELTHTVYDYTPFAKGALDGLLYVASQPPGLYSFQDVLGLGQ